jgi:hypothetical protein
MLIMKHFNKKMLLICPILKARAENFGKKIVGEIKYTMDVVQPVLVQ